MWIFSIESFENLQLQKCPVNFAYTTRIYHFQPIYLGKIVLCIKLHLMAIIQSFNYVSYQVLQFFALAENEITKFYGQFAIFIALIFMYGIFANFGLVDTLRQPLFIQFDRVFVENISREGLVFIYVYYSISFFYFVEFLK